METDEGTLNASYFLSSIGMYTRPRVKWPVGSWCGTGSWAQGLRWPRGWGGVGGRGSRGCGDMYTHSWFTMLDSRNLHVVKQLYSNWKIKMHIITHTKSSEKPKYSSAPTTWLLWRKQNYRECKRWMVWKPFHTHRRRNEGWIGVNRGCLGQKNPTM